MSKQSWKGSTLLNPEPPVLVSCGGLDKPNLITIGWTGTICTQPSMVSISVRPERYSHHLIKESGQFAINLPTEQLVRAVDWCGVKSGRDNDKFSACKLHAAPGKALRSGHRPGRGQLQHQVRPVPDGHLRPGKLVHGGKFPPLGEAATHGTHHRSLPVQLLQHPPVPQMEGVIFADHAENGHAITPFQEITNSYKLVTN